MTWWHGALLGLVAGAHVATWGAYKDSPYEGFHWHRFLRSIGVAMTIGALLSGGFGFDRTESMIVLLGVIYGLERLLTEFWKLFFRGHQADAFTIPMRFGVFGRPVDDPGVRYVLGVGLTMLTVAACWVVSWIQSSLPAQSHGFLVLFAGISGWLTAVGGAWKDAPIEGFSGWKFLRSPVVATAWAAPLSFLTDNWVLLSLSAGGFAVASIETYKAFLVRNRPPGKFDGKPIRFRFTHRRDILAGAHACMWGSLAVALTYGLIGPAAPPTPDAEVLARVAVAILAAAGSFLVISRALVMRPAMVAS
jgi:hypothetical protein